MSGRRGITVLFGLVTLSSLTPSVELEVGILRYPTNLLGCRYGETFSDDYDCSLPCPSTMSLF